MRALVSFLTLVSAYTLVSHASALEKVSRFDTVEGQRGWQSGASCSIVYYNRCNLWSYGWGGLGGNASETRIGICAESCCGPDPTMVTATQLRVFTGASGPGWGFTGSIGLQTVDENCCPDQVLASVPYLPTGPYDVHSWFQVVPANFAVVVTLKGISNDAVIGTDHPSAGPTGPQACGFCYPLNRVTHSFLWGSVASPVCPGSTLNDGDCNAEFRLDVFVAGCVDAVEPSSWGSIKTLYR